MSAMVLELPRWSQDRPPNLRHAIPYLLIRLLAIAGILFIGDRLYTLWISPEAGGIKVPFSGTAADTQSDVEHTSSASKTKAIIAASMRDDNTSWIGEHFPDWQRNIFIMDDAEAALTVTRSGGNEASAYLTYIINHYYNLPDYMVFLHARRYQWHNDDVMYDHVPILQALKLSHVDKVGYQNLRCNGDPGCPMEVHPEPGGSDGEYEWSAAYGDAWEHLWPGVPVPEAIGAPCCAQFAVTRAQVLKRTVRDYERIRMWLWDSDNHLESHKSGRIMEYTWHILFGQEAVSCPTAKDCYCAAFGACDLDCPSDRWCDGRWWQPAMLQMLPDEWPALEFQGNNGWPTDGWWRNKTNLPTEPIEYQQKWAAEHSTPALSV